MCDSTWLKDIASDGSLFRAVAVSWAEYYKTFYGGNLQTFTTSWSV